MSRVGRKPIVIPAGVSVKIEGPVVTITGPKGTLTKTFQPQIGVNVEGNEIIVTRPNDEKVNKQLHGTTRALIQGMVDGVSKGFEIGLEIKGIGYRATMEGNTLVLGVGYSHPVKVAPVEGVKVETKSATEILVSGIDKQAVGQVAAVIRSVREPEPYLGKGIAYKGERIRRKEGKKAGKK